MPQDVSASASSSRRKAREKIASPPEIHLTVLFVHEVLKQTPNMDAFCGDSFQTFFHTATWNVVNNEVFYGQNPLIRPGHHNNTLWWARQLQIVASFVNGKTTWWSLLFEAQKERPSWTHFFHHGHVIARKHKDLVFSSWAKLKSDACVLTYEDTSSKDVDFRNQLTCHLSGPRRITWRIPKNLELFCSTQLDHKQSSIENICQMNVFGLDKASQAASLPCDRTRTYPTLESSNTQWLNPRGWQKGNVAEQKVTNLSGTTPGNL